jgi:hypothetical protein
MRDGVQRMCSSWSKAVPVKWREADRLARDAPPPRNRSAGHEKYEIDYERLAAFFVEPGQAALIDKGTWHFAVALGAECDLINVTRKDPGEGTSDIDAEMRMDRIPSMRPYVEVLDFARRDKRVLELET